MAIPGYVWIFDAQNQLIESHVDIEGREGSAEVLGFEHNVRIPADADTGVLTGTRKHEDFIILKSFCQATPLLNQACTRGESLKKVRLSWYRIAPSGGETEYFRQELSDVHVVSVRPHIYDVKSPMAESKGHLEYVHFRYRKIRWEYLEGHIVTEDEWSHRSAHHV